MSYYSLASDSWGWREKFAIRRVMRSGRYTMGEEVSKFETAFAKKMGIGNAVMTNSGSSANLIGLAALVYKNEIKPGSEVIVPAVSWSTTYFPIIQLGLVPVFVDVSETTFNMAPDLVKDAITKKTCAVLAVNLLGMPCQLTELDELCRSNNIFLIEDNCESLGAMYNNRQAGTFGTFGTYSFFFSHHIQTMEGGMIVTDDEALADYMRSLRAHGWVRDVKTDVLYKKGSEDSFHESFKFVLPGYCVRPLEMSGAIGSVQLNKLDSMIDQRRKNAEVFVKEFGKDYFIQRESSNAQSSWFGFAVAFKSNHYTAYPKTSRNERVNLLKAYDIETRPIIAGNFLNQPVMKHMNNHRVSGKIIHAEYLDKHGFMFGNNHRDLSKQIAKVRTIL